MYLDRDIGLTALILALAVCTAASSRVLVEPELSLPSRTDWFESRPALAHENLTLYIFMRHDDASVKRMEELLGAVSDPKSPQYGRYLTLDDLERLAPIKQESLDTVRNFILSVAPAALFGVHSLLFASNFSQPLPSIQLSIRC